MKIKSFNVLAILLIICAILSSCEETQVPITRIGLSQTSLIMEVDSTAKLVAEILPLYATNETLNWYSSDTTIAKVSSDGIVSGISPGIAIITAESNIGHLVTCEVNVIKIIEHNPIENINFGATPFMAFDNNDNLWYGGSGGIYKMGLDGLGWRFFPMNTEVEGFDFDSKNNLWAATTTMGLLIFDGQMWTNFDSLNSDLPTNWISTVCVDQNDNIWVGFGGNRYYPNKVGKFDGKQWVIFDSEECLISDWHVFKIYVDKQNNIWFAHHKGVSMFDGSSWELFIDNNEFVNPNILDIGEDNENNLWFTSTRYGVFKYDWTNILNYNTKNSSISSDFIQSVGIDIKGNKWFGNTMGVINFDGTNWINLSYPDFFIPDIRANAIDSEGNKWFASPSRIYQILD